MLQILKQEKLTYHNFVNLMNMNPLQYNNQQPNKSDKKIITHINQT